MTLGPGTNQCDNFLQDGEENVDHYECCSLSSILSEFVSSPQLLYQQTDFATSIVNACPSNDISVILNNDTIASYATANPISSK